MRLLRVLLLATLLVVSGEASVLGAPPPRGAPGAVKGKAHSSQGPRKSAPRKGASIPVTDDPSKALEEVWTRHLNQWFQRVQPAAGAFVAIDPETGEVLALSDHAARGVARPRPAVSTIFPAASVFKIVTSAALLKSRRVSPSTSVCYRGGTSRLDAIHLTDRPSDHTCRSLKGAFAHSTNAVFGKLATRHLSPDELLEMAESLGFNQSLQVGDLQTRPVALRPRDHLDFARMAAGFTRSNLSPLGGAVLAAIVASGGRWPSKVLRNGQPVQQRQVLPEEVCRDLRAMMRATSRDGTGARYFAGLAGESGGVAVKSGTLTSRDGSGLFDTWMVGFFPAERPRFAFAALVATRGPGPVRAGHLARFAIQTWVTLERLRRPST